MNKAKKVCVVTGSRAEYGLLFWLMKEIEVADDLELQIVATGMHLSPEFNLTYKQIEQDGFNISHNIEMLLSSDSEVGITKSMGLAMIGFADALADLESDLLVVLGDRFEIFSAVSAATIAKIPVAHLHGGEITEGAFDEAFRHSITKMSHLHFVSTEAYRSRVIQLGESPDRVFNVGAIGIDNIKRSSLLSREVLEKAIGFELGKWNLLITFHPVTLENSTAKEQFGNLLSVLDELEEIRLLFTKANSDTDGRIINYMIDEYVQGHHDKSVSFTSLGSVLYLSAMQYMDGVVGNSSSGLLEAPSVGVGTINIGDRQRGRVKARSVIDCDSSVNGIREAFQVLFSQAFRSRLRDVFNPYGEGGVSEKIVQIVKEYPLDRILKKKFYNL